MDIGVGNNQIEPFLHSARVIDIMNRSTAFIGLNRNSIDGAR